MVTPLTDTAATTVTLFRVALIMLMAGHPVLAQPRTPIYAGGALASLAVDADEVDGRSVAGALFGGVALSSNLDLELEIAWPSQPFTRSTTGIAFSVAPPGASREEIERLSVTARFDRGRDVSWCISGAVVIHTSLGHRVAPGVVIGVATQRARERTIYTPTAIAPGIDPASSIAQVREEIHDRNVGALTFGANLAVRLTPHLYVVPDVRYDYGSIGDEINNTLRTSVRAAWRF